MRLLLCVLLAASAGVPAGAADGTDLRMLTSWSPHYIGVPKIAERFANKVTEASNGSIRFIVTGPEGIPAFEQFIPVTLGIFDLLFTHGGFHLDHTAVGSALDAVSAQPAALRESGLWTAVDARYREFGLKLLALPVSALGHQIYLREPIDAQCALAGRRIRGSALYAPLLAALGAITVTLPASATRAALDRRLVDGAAWTAVGSVELRWSEASRYLLRPFFGSFTHLLLINLERWEALGDAEQKLLLVAGAELETKTYARFRKYALKEENELKTRGMLTTNLCGEALATLPRRWADGIWQLAAEHDGEAVHALREQARTAGLTP